MPTWSERLLAAAILACGLAGDAQVSESNTQVYRVSRQSQWQKWTFPAGTLDIDVTGSVTPAAFRKMHNAALESPGFAHLLSSGRQVPGGVWKSGSGEETAGHLIDGNVETFWRPEPNAPLEDWWAEIDLGRATLVSEIRLRFPDREGARPFREFRVFGSEGHRVTRSDIFSFHLIGGTTRPNQDTVVVYDVEPVVRAARRIISDRSPTPDPKGRDETYDLIQYIRFLADARSPDAALAEVEVITPGDNVALGTLRRGGTIRERAGRGFAFNMADGDANTEWLATRGRGQDPMAWDWDLGALFWLDRIVMRTSEFELRTRTAWSPQIRTHGISVSDGSRTLTGAIDYEDLFAADAEALLASASDLPGQITYRFPPQPVRWLAAEWASADPRGSQSGSLTETLIFAVGHVARVEMTSDFVDLGGIAGDGREKVIQSLAWEADLPPGTFIQARTRSGSELKENHRYFRKDGAEVSKEQYDQMPRQLRGEISSSTTVSDDWSNWSDSYQAPGETFRSPSPRRYAQIQLILGADRPETTPTLRSVSLDFTDAFLTDVHGTITPRVTEPGSEETFIYRIIPTHQGRDPGFDRLLIRTPSRVRVEDLALRIGDSESDPTSVLATDDSLLVELPHMIRTQEIELTFNAVLIRNPTLVRAFVGSDRHPGVWQPVEPLEHASTTVLLPSVPSSRRLITNLSIPPAFSPNGDGVGDVAQIRFHVVKVDVPAKVDIFSLDGRHLRTLEREVQTDLSYLYQWSGTDDSGRLVPPGIYLCRILLEAQSGKEDIQRAIAVAY